MNKNLIFSMLLALPASAAAPEAAEVKAAHGAVELSFAVHEKTIKAGEFPWVRISQKNVGKGPIFPHSPVFSDPYALKSNGYAKVGIYLEARGPDGKKMEHALPRNAGHEEPIQDGPSGLLDDTGEKEKRLIAEWRKSGLSDSEIKRKLVDHNLKKRREEGHASEPEPRTLEPGESIQTPTWFEHGRTDEYKGRPQPAPVMGFFRLEFFDFIVPGSYKIRAVYDLSPPGGAKAYKTKTGRDPLPEMTTVKTPWIELKVVP